MILVLFLSIMAIAVSALLVHIHQEMASRGETRFCTFSENLDCAPALRSRWSEVYGIPVAALGLTFYAVLGSLAAAGLYKTRYFDRNSLLLTIMALFAALFSGRLAYISFTRLRAFCPWCTVLQALSLLILIAAIFAWRGHAKGLAEVISEEAATFRDNRLLSAGLAAAILLFLVGIPWMRARERERFIARSEAYTMLLEGTFPRLDLPDNFLRREPVIEFGTAPLEIVVVQDFFCDWCRTSRYDLEDIADAYGGRIISVDFPHDTACNPVADYSRPGSCQAAVLGNIAQRFDRYHEYEEIAFSAPGMLISSNLPELEEMLDLPPGTLLNWKYDTEAWDLLREETRFDMTAGIRRTPTIFINGMPMEGWHPRWFVERVVEGELERSR